MIEIRKADTRFHTRLSWLDSHHCFSFGSHYDPDNTHHGLLLVSNDDRVQPGTGFGTHAHQDMEIVTWVLAGRLEHRDSEGNHGELYPGLAQRMSAGTGITHSEMNPSTTEAVRFIQMWVTPDTKGLPPSYEQHDVHDLLTDGGLHLVASGTPGEGVSINQRDAKLFAGRLARHEKVSMPQGEHVHVFIARGGAHLADNHLHEGDAARITGRHDLELTTPHREAEVLVWATT